MRIEPRITDRRSRRPGTSPDTLFVCIDEAGNSDFSSHGTRYLVMSCVVTIPPFTCHDELLSAKYGFLAEGLDIEYLGGESSYWRSLVAEVIRTMNVYHFGEGA